MRYLVVASAVLAWLGTGAISAAHPQTATQAQASAAGKPVSSGAPGVCEEAKRTNGWCEPGNVGYVAAVEIRSRFLYEALDAHSHDIDPAGVTCETCRKALKTDGYCPAHKMGYVGGHAYMSRITYELARGRRIDPAALTCPVCRKSSQGIGWCEKDHLGIAGYVAVDDRRQFEDLLRAYQLLLAAVDMSARCETCAAAMIADGYCGIHRVKYEGGRVVSGTPP